MLKIGVTGGIGSGKTTVCRIFETLGVPVFYADEASRHILLNDASVRIDLIKFFGEEILTNGKPDRAKLGKTVFKDKKNLQKLNEILHPPTLKQYFDWQEMQSNYSYTIIEAALIYETGADQMIDQIIVVTAPRAVRIKRIMQRNKWSEEAVSERINHQLESSFIETRADFIIYNDEQKMVIPQVLAIHKSLSKLSGGNLEEGKAV